MPLFIATLMLGGTADRTRHLSLVIEAPGEDDALRVAGMQGWNFRGSPESGARITCHLEKGQDSDLASSDILPWGNRELGKRAGMLADLEGQLEIEDGPEITLLHQGKQTRFRLCHVVFVDGQGPEKTRTSLGMCSSEAEAHASTTLLGPAPKVPLAYNAEVPSRDAMMKMWKRAVVTSETVLGLEAFMAEIVGKTQGRS